MKDKIKYLRFKEKYGRTALVAGGSDGLGAAFAEALARRNMNLVLMARQKERLEITADRLKEKYGVEVTAIAADMKDIEDVKDKIAALHFPIDLLVYNAAFAPIGLFESTSEEHLSLAATVNVKSPLLLSKALSVQMIKNKRGGIVLMSSLSGSQGSPKLAAYSATKAFNAILAEALWKELKPHGIDVIGCCAGAILTPGYQKAEKAKLAPGTLTAGQVAEITLNALGKGPVVVPGIVNKIGRFMLTRLLTRKAAINIMLKNTEGLS